MAKAHGVAGEVVVIPETDDPNRFAPGATVYLSGGQALTVRASKPGERGWLVSFVEISQRSHAQTLVGRDLVVEANDRRSLPDDEFWPDQLVGLLVRDLAGRELGRIVEVDDSTAQARLVVATENGQVEVPFVDDLVPEVNLAGGYVVLAPVPGLFD